MGREGPPVSLRPLQPGRAVTGLAPKGSENRRNGNGGPQNWGYSGYFSPQKSGAGCWASAAIWPHNLTRTLGRCPSPLAAHRCRCESPRGTGSRPGAAARPHRAGPGRCQTSKLRSASLRDVTAGPGRPVTSRHRTARRGGQTDRPPSRQQTLDDLG